MTDLPSNTRWMAVAGALAGALGVVFAAAAAHGEGAASLGAASAMLLAHAPVLLILGLGGAAKLRFGAVGAGLFVAGLVLFAGEIGLRNSTGMGLFVFAAPLGGTLLIAGWLAVALGAVFARR
jgi:uncharacterized membrane protein YgdD (TMEM256/DUF423 family)